PASGAQSAVARVAQTDIGRRLFASKAIPDGSLHGLSEYFFVTAAFAASISTISLVSSMLVKIFPVPSATENSGLPGSAIVAAALLPLASMTVAFFERPLNTNTRLVPAS